MPNLLSPLPPVWRRKLDGAWEVTKSIISRMEYHTPKEALDHFLAVISQNTAVKASVDKFDEATLEEVTKVLKADHF